MEDLSRDTDTKGAFSPNTRPVSTPRRIGTASNLLTLGSLNSCSTVSSTGTGVCVGSQKSRTRKDNQPALLEPRPSPRLDSHVDHVEAVTIECALGARLVNSEAHAGASFVLSPLGQISGVEKNFARMERTLRSVCSGDSSGSPCDP